MDVKKLPSIPPGGDGRYTAAATPPPEGGMDPFTARALHAFQQKGITHITENMTDNHRPRYSLGEANHQPLNCNQPIGHVQLEAGDP